MTDKKKTGVRQLDRWYPEEYEVNEFTVNNHFYLHFGFHDTGNVLTRANGTRLAKYNTVPIDTALLKQMKR